MPPVPDKEPQKYIRTFEGDAATLQKGGRPDLVPFDDAHANEAAAAVTASPVSFAPTVQSPTGVTSSAPISPPESAVASEKPQPSVPIILPSKSAPMVTTPNRPETYESDFSARVKDTSASTATILAAEQDAARGAPAPAPIAQKAGSMLYAIGGAVLLLIAAGGMYYAYTQYVLVQQPVAVIGTFDAPIFVDERTEVSGTSIQLAQQIEQSVAHPLAVGAVRFLYTPTATTTDNSVFAALQLPAPNVLLRNVNAVGSMAGVVNAGGVQSPFFILSVDSYSDTFAGMLSWEPTMSRDLALFFPPYPVPVASVATTTATSTSSANKSPVSQATASTTTAFVGTFHDEVIANHDVRVYRDAAHKSVVLYGYWDQKTLVIARDEGAFTELVRRLSTSQAAH